MKVDLSQFSNRAPKEINKKKAKEEFALIQEELKEQITLLHANKKHSLLIVLQGMDASGKDGTVRRVFSKVTPTAVNATSFKKPTEIELGHDFLWRVHKSTPAKGEVKIFNRSHYEDVLVTRVLGLIDDAKAEQNIKAINNFEQCLVDNNTIVLKFFLNVSKDEQYERLMERKTNLAKHWKHSDGDWETREGWDEYMKYYEQVFAKCSVAAPWHVIPADQNWYKAYLVGKTIVTALKKLNMTYPELNIE